MQTYEECITKPFVTINPSLFNFYLFDKIDRKGFFTSISFNTNNRTINFCTIYSDMELYLIIAKLNAVSNFYKRIVNNFRLCNLNKLTIINKKGGHIMQPTSISKTESFFGFEHLVTVNPASTLVTVNRNLLNSTTRKIFDMIYELSNATCKLCHATRRPSNLTCRFRNATCKQDNVTRRFYFETRKLSIIATRNFATVTLLTVDNFSISSIINMVSNNLYFEFVNKMADTDKYDISINVINNINNVTNSRGTSKRNLYGNIKNVFLLDNEMINLLIKRHLLLIIKNISYLLADIKLNNVSNCYNHEKERVFVY